MFNKIKEYFTNKTILDLTNKLLDLKNHNEKLKEDNRRLEKDNFRLCFENRLVANTVIKDILGRSIEWFDYEDKSEAYQKEYYESAQDLLRNPVFLNEFNSFVVDLTKAVLSETDDEKLLKGDAEKVLLIKYSLNGIKAFKERIESIKVPEEKHKPDINELNELL